MALTQQQIQASKDYMSGKISSDEYKRLYIPNYNPTKDPTAGKNIQFQPNPVVEQRLQEQVQRVEQPVQQVQRPIQGQTQQPVQPIRDFTSQISQQYDLATQNMVNQLKQRIAQARSEQEGIISRAPQQFDPLRSQSELAKGQQLRSVLERNALMGDRGGVGRSQALQTQTAGENRLNQINLQQQNVIDTANQRIADLEAQGRFEEASIIQQQKLAELQALMREQQRQDEISRQDLLRSQDLARQDQLMGQEQSREDFATSIMANYNDLSAYRDRLRAQGAPQWQIDQVEAARLQKIMEQNLDPRTGQPLPTTPDFSQTLRKWESGLTLTPQEMQVIGATTPTKPRTPTGNTGPTITQDRSYAFDKWKSLGRADEEVARILNVPVGTVFGGEQPTQGPITYVDVDTALGQIKEPSQAADLLVNLEASGQLANVDDNELTILQNKYRISESQMQQAINRYNARTQGISLPTGRVTR